MRVLIVDDHEDYANMFAEMLQLWGYTVRVAYSGGEALTAAREFAPEVVLCDLVMPEIDGCQVAEQLCREATFTETRFVALTGMTTSEVRDRALAAGFERVLLKPFDLHDLRRLLENPGAEEPV
ncbi:MAG: response regulator [Armatimonadota bacterium]